MGLNHRISELNAAVGLAQLRKLDAILETQRAHKGTLRKALATVDGVTLRALPDEDGDSATFLSFLMDDEARARKAAADLAAAGVDGCFYWYDNNWHYIRQWEHLKAMQAAAPLPATLVADRPDYATVSLPESDAVMGRTLSMQIKLSWRREEVAKRAETMVRVLKSV